MFEMDDRLFDTSSDRSPRLLTPFMAMRVLYPFASSIGLRSSRWMFSMRARRYISASSTSFTMTGTLSRPALFDAWYLLSPAMIS